MAASESGGFTLGDFQITATAEVEVFRNGLLVKEEDDQ